MPPYFRLTLYLLAAMLYMASGSSARVLCFLYGSVGMYRITVVTRERNRHEYTCATIVGAVSLARNEIQYGQALLVCLEYVSI